MSMHWNIILLLKMLMVNYTFLHGKNSAYNLKWNSNYTTIYYIQFFINIHVLYITCIIISERLYTKIWKMAMSNRIMNEFNIKSFPPSISKWLAIISILSHNCHFFFLVRIVKMYSISNIKVYNTVLLAIITMLDIRSQNLLIL